MNIKSPFDIQGLGWQLNICLSSTSIHSNRITVFQLQEGLRMGQHVCVHVAAFCRHIKLMSTFACLNESRFKEKISAARLFHGMNNLNQHFCINVNNVSDVMAIKQFLCCATDLNHKSLLNENLSVFFFTGQFLLFTSFGYEVTKTS